MRSFDPRRVGTLEARAWETYYRRKWAAFLVASVGLVRAAFRMGWRDTLAGAWLVLRANQKWAPYPDNDPAAARGADGQVLSAPAPRLSAPRSTPFAPRELEVEWWRAHREHQRDDGSAQELIGALSDLYSYTYSADRGEVRRAAELRAEAMDVSDRWVDAGCDPGSPLLAEERALLVRSYAALLAAVHR